MIALFLLAGGASIVLTSIVWLYDLVERYSLNKGQLELYQTASHYGPKRLPNTSRLVHYRKVQDYASALYPKQSR